MPPPVHRATDSSSAGPTLRTLVRGGARTQAAAGTTPDLATAPTFPPPAHDDPDVDFHTHEHSPPSANHPAVSSSSALDHQPRLAPLKTAGPSLVSHAGTASASGVSFSSPMGSQTEKFSMPEHPLYHSYDVEPDPHDYLHNPDPKGTSDRNHGMSWTGALNILTLVALALGLIMLFAGYPIYTQYSHHSSVLERLSGSLGGTNGTGQIPSIPIRPLIDTDTPQDARKWQNSENQSFDLVFSDEFNEEGRTFWPGDDPFWEAMNIYYSATNDYEWYSPEAVNTTGGALVLTLTQKDTHNLNFQSGMVQSWNKFCFSGGYIEFSMLMPEQPYTQGYWPAAWIMGNLGRPGYLGSTDGMWPYSYSSCDTGILPNQTYLNKTGPYEALHSKGQWAKDGVLSYLDGMRSPSCTCPGEDHPGPNPSVARAAPEIDVIEAQVQQGYHDKKNYHTYASCSLQTAPFDVGYWWKNTTQYRTIYNESISRINDYHGSVYQEAVSGLTQCPDDGFSKAPKPRFIRYGVEYEPDWKLNGGGYARWWIDGKPAWRVEGTALGPVPELDVGQRHMPVEPMSIIMNLGISPGFQMTILNPDDPRGLRFPAQLKYDYVRVYQPTGQMPRIGCDPPDYPTAAYIERNKDVYYNPNITTFPRAWPKNKLTHPGC